MCVFTSAVLKRVPQSPQCPLKGEMASVGFREGGHFRALRALAALCLVGTASCFSPALHGSLTARRFVHGEGFTSPRLNTPMLKSRWQSRQSNQLQMGLGGSALATIGVKALTKNPLYLGVGLAVALLGYLYYLLSVPSRAYLDGAGTVGNEYDAWTEEGLLEYYWVCT